jgi:hypothetical protein
MMKRKIRVYVAGKLNDRTCCGFIQNASHMIQVGRLLQKKGFATYIPALDTLTGLIDGEMEYQDYFDNSQAWLMASDAVFLLDNWRTSPGANKEVELATSLGIPVCTGIRQLKNVKPRDI